MRPPCLRKTAATARSASKLVVMAAMFAAAYDKTDPAISSSGPAMLLPRAPGSSAGPALLLFQQFRVSDVIEDGGAIAARGHRCCCPVPSAPEYRSDPELPGPEIIFSLDHGGPETTRTPFMSQIIYFLRESRVMRQPRGAGNANPTRLDEFRSARPASGQTSLRPDQPGRSGPGRAGLLYDVPCRHRDWPMERSSPAGVIAGCLAGRCGGW